MHRALRIAGLAVAGAVLIAAGVVAYAAYNLTGLIARHQQRILQRASAALGRPVKVGQIKARVGVGLAIEVDDLEIADNPTFSHDPFLSAARFSLDVEFVPLLHGKVKVHELELTDPVIRILKRADGILNVDSLGGNSAAPAGVGRGRGGAGAMSGVVWAIARQVSIKGLAIDDGTIYFSDAGLKGVPLQITHLGLEMSGFHTGSPFDIELKSAVFSDQPNIAVSGKMGPMLRQGVLDIPGCPLDLKFKLGPLSVDNLRTLMAPGAILPATISMPDVASAEGTVNGTLANFQIAASSDLSGYRIIYHEVSNKSGTSALTLKLAGRGAIIGALRPMAPEGGWDLTATLSQVAAWFEGAQRPAITDLNGRIHLTPTRLEVQPTTFTLGSGHATLQARADSLTPLRAAFSLDADSLQLSQIVPSRSPGEFVSQLAISGRAHGAMAAPAIDARVKSGSGLVEGLAYRNLDLTAAYAGDRVSAQPLSLDAFDGSVVANVNAVVAARPPFDASASLRHINVARLLHWLDVQTSAVSGFLSADARVSGAGTAWKDIQPTLRSSGRMYLSGGELHGVNIVAIALNKIAAAPVVSQLVSVAFRSSHQHLFAESSTDLRQASMTYNLYGQRVTTNDLLIESPDYTITGAGWFDFDKNINMSGDIKLTLGLSAAIPVMVMGKYPALLVIPDIPKVAERTAAGVISAPVNILKGGASAVGSVLGGIRSVLP